jgi:signal transduction histidine kinase
VKPIPLRDREYREGLARLERRAIIPIKWAILLVTLAVWLCFINQIPTTPVFALFFVYFLLIGAQSYFFYVSGVSIVQIKPLALFSYLTDVVFVSLLIYFDLTTTYFGPQSHHQFYVLYFLLVMRGFALFQSLGETIFVNLLISALYVLIFYIANQDAQSHSLGFLLDSGFATSLILIWLVILMSWFIVVVITRQKQELMEVNERLLRADSLARVGELAAGVAHEINNPMAIIAANADYLKLRTPPDDERIEEIEAIHREAMRCKRIVQEMLTYANPRPAGDAPLDPRAINDEVVRFVFPRAQPGELELKLDYEENVPMISVDPNLLKQALLNLYINARQALPPDRVGQIISRIYAAEQGRRLRIEIEDNGMGIPEEELEQIFEPFFTRKPKGTGLGLAVTQSVIEKSGGTISVTSKAGSWTKFVLEFPAVR